jgi:molybdopterin converting factor small subunit
LSERIKCGIEQSRDNEHDINGAFVELQKYAFSIGQDTYYKKLHASITKEAERWERSTRSFVTPECKAKLWRDRCLVEAAFIGSKINYLGVDQKSNIVDPVAVRDNMIKCRASLNKALGHVANHPDNVQLQVIVDDLEKHLAKKLGAFQQEDRYNIVNGNNAQPWK